MWFAYMNDDHPGNRGIQAVTCEVSDIHFCTEALDKVLARESETAAAFKFGGQWRIRKFCIAGYQDLDTSVPFRHV